jgi:hypothetical protein
MLGRLKMWLAAAGALLVALGAAYLKGRSAKAREVENGVLWDYQETRGRMDEVDIPGNPADARQWLLDRQRRGDL